MLYVLTNAYTSNLDYMQLSLDDYETMKRALPIDQAIHRAVGPEQPCGNPYCHSSQPATSVCCECYQHYCGQHIVQYTHDDYCWPCLGDVEYTPPPLSYRCEFPLEEDFVTNDPVEIQDLREEWGEDFEIYCTQLP